MVLCILWLCMCIDNVQFDVVVCNDACEEREESDNKQTAPSVARLC